MEGAAEVVSLPTWMQLGVTFIVLLFAAGSGIFSYIHSAKSSHKSDAETVELLRRLAQSNEAVEGSRGAASFREMLVVLNRIAESSEELLELVQEQRDDARVDARAEAEVERRMSKRRLVRNPIPKDQEQ